MFIKLKTENRDLVELILNKNHIIEISCIEREYSTPEYHIYVVDFDCPHRIGKEEYTRLSKILLNKDDKVYLNGQ